jgi:hypothetical protein
MGATIYACHRGAPVAMAEHGTMGGTMAIVLTTVR